jgi:dolichyl-phosphate beta-glucosyltransferase
MTSLVLPTFNPGRRIQRTWEELKAFLQEAPGAWEVLFICDGCTDGTPDRLAEWIRSESLPVRLLSYPVNRGKGHAVRHGLQAATGQWRLFTDVDLAYGFADVVRLAQTLQAGADVAIASRWHPASQILVAAPLQGWHVFRRHVQSQVFSRLVRWLLPLRQQDTQAGLKGLSAAASRLVLPYLGCNGFGFDCELLTACTRLGLAITEVPVCVRYDHKTSTTSAQSMFRMMGDLWRIRRAWRRGLPAVAPVEPIPAEQPVNRPGTPPGQSQGGSVPLPLLSRGVS